MLTLVLRQKGEIVVKKGCKKGLGKRLGGHFSFVGSYATLDESWLANMGLMSWECPEQWD